MGEKNLFSLKLRKQFSHLGMYDGGDGVYYSKDKSKCEKTFTWMLLSLALLRLPFISCQSELCDEIQVQADVSVPMHVVLLPPPLDWQQ